MLVRKPFAGVLVLALAAAACGGSGATQTPAGATQQPAATTDGGGGGATQAPAGTQTGGGGGGSIDTTYGKVHIEISGPITKSGDYGFIPAGSLFGGTQGSSLNFTNDATNEIVSIVISAEGTVVVSYGSTDMSVPAAECTTSNWNIGTTNASGSFDCNAALAVTASGAMVQGVKLKGNFDAHT